MAKGQTPQEKAAQARAERAKQIQAEVQERYRIAKEQERLFNEQLAHRTPEEVEAEKAHWEADRQIEIETAQKRHSVETEEEALYREQVRASLARIARIADEGE